MTLTATVPWPLLPATVRYESPAPRTRVDSPRALGDHADVTPDSELIERFLDGDGGAVAAVETWVRASATPYRAVLGDDWEDGVQEAMIAVLEQLRAGRFAGRSTLKTYVWKLTAYRFADRFRSQKKRSWVTLETEPLRDRRPDPLKRAQARDRFRLATRVMERLSGACKNLWRLTLAGLDYRQMSEELAVSEGTLRVRMLRCRDRALRLEEKLSLPPIGGLS